MKRKVQLARKGEVLALYEIDLGGHEHVPNAAEYVQKALSRAVDEGVIQLDDYDVVFTVLWMQADRPAKT